jgi:hypothetical protein
MTAPPAISGHPEEGQLLHVQRGTWRGRKPIAFSVQWRLCDPTGATCTDIPAATARAYAARHSDTGHTLGVRMTATNADGSNSASAAPTAIVAAAPSGAPVATARPSIDGKTQTEAMLTVRPAAWTGTPPIDVRYDWWRCDRTGGTCINRNRHGTTYGLTGDDVDHTLRLIVRGQNSIGGATSLSDPTAIVTAAATAPVPSAAPTVAGTAQVGATLTGNRGAWANNPTSYMYTWLRCDTNGGNCGSTGLHAPAYKLTTTDLGHRIRLRIEAANQAGTHTADSSPTAVIVAAPAAPLSAVAPTVSGTAQVGATLTANRGSWSGNPTSYTYTWIRCDANNNNCLALPAHGSSYQPTSADVGHRLRFRVEAANAGGHATADSAPTAVIAAAPQPPALGTRPSVSGTAQAGNTLTGNRGGWSGNPTSYTYTWMRCDANNNNNCVALPTHGSSYQLTSADIGHRLRFRVEAANPVGHATADSAATAVIAAAPAPPALSTQPTLSGASQAGQTMIGNRGSWNGNPTGYTYTWIRCDANNNNCVALPAHSSSYQLTSADVGHRLRFRVEAANAAGRTTAYSAASALVTQVQTGDVAGAVKVISKTQSINTVSLPDRLVIDRVKFVPRHIRSRHQTLVARFHVSEITHGRSVAGALVYAVGVPFNRLSAGAEVATGQDGWARVRFHVRPTVPLRRGNLVVVFIRVRKPRGDVLAGVSARRLVALTVG